MKMLGVNLFAACATALLTMGSAGAADKATAPSNAAFEALKKLAGDWVAVDANGKPTEQVVSSIKLTAAGSAVHETIFPGSDHEMITVYYMDGKDLVLTHYCMLGNQPHLKADPESNAKRIVFKFASGGNLNADKDSHMHDAVLEIVDDQHFKTEWTRCEGGKECDKHGFNLVRKQK